jgi:hypothetical protein
MPIRVKSAAEIAAKWSRVAPQRDADYKSGVADPAVDWAKAAAASEETFAAGVQDAIGRGAFAKGVAKAGDEKWRRKTSEVGTQRWAQGIRAAAGDFEAGFAPFKEALERVELPPRAPRGDPRNLERVAAVARALSERRRR